MNNTHTSNLQAKNLSKLQKRLYYLENLLTANLDNLTSQQKHYDLELTRKTETTKRMQAAMEALES